MWPLLLLGVGALLIKAFSEENSDKKDKKIFISFSMKDRQYRDFLVQQAKKDKSPFNFTDMSVNEPWDEEKWKRECRKWISKCDGMIVLLSKNTWHSKGTRWEIKCANELGLKIIGLHIKKEDKGAIPPELDGKIIEWTWNNLDKAIKKI
ncbi:MAG: TIR domain-containing protein [Bacteroidota bacterium]|nr:TIR domain-containing protein [Bacteroidota bacterium]